MYNKPHDKTNGSGSETESRSWTRSGRLADVGNLRHHSLPHHTPEIVLLQSNRRINATTQSLFIRYISIPHRPVPSLQNPRYIQALATDIHDVALFGDMYKTAFSWRGAITIIRLLLRQVLPGVAPILLSHISRTANGDANPDFLAHSSTHVYLGVGLAMISAPLVEKALFNKFYLDWKTPAGLSRAARRHIIVALALVIQIVGSLVGMITASTAAGIIIGKQSGLGPIVSPAGGAVLAIFLGAVSNVNANTMLRRQGIPPADTYDVDEDALDGVMDCVAIQVQFAISGAVGLIGVLVGAVVAWVEYKEDSVAKSSWLVHTYIPVVGDFYIPANALLQFNLQMYQAPKAFLLVKADFARRHTLLHRHA